MEKNYSKLYTTNISGISFRDFTLFAFLGVHFDSYGFLCLLRT